MAASIKLRRFWFDLTHPKEWYLCHMISSIIWKIKDYDRLEYDYGCVLDHATCSRMSKTNYDKDTIYAVIDDAQRELHYFAVKDDINELINEGATIDEIKDYVNQL
jgi:hypothetical protein